MRRACKSAIICIQQERVCRNCISNTKYFKREFISAKKEEDTLTWQRPESPVVTLTCMQVNFKKVHKLHQRYISSIAWSNFKHFFSYFFLLLLHFSLFSCSTVSHLSLEVYFSARFCNTVFIQGILCHMWLLHVYSQCGYVNQISGTPIEPDLDTFLCVNVSLCTTPTANLSARNQF